MRTWGPDTVATTSRWSAALFRLEMWRYSTRLVPWPLAAASTSIGTAWAVRSHLDTANERSVLAVISTLALCAVFDDQASAFTTATPTPRWARQLTRAAVPVIVLGLAWALVVAAVTSLHTGPVEAAPTWAIALEWCAVASSQLAVAAIGSHRAGSTGSVLPGLVVSLVWIVAGANPLLHGHLFPVSEQVAAWSTLLCAASVIVAATSREWSWRLPGGSVAAVHATGRRALPDPERPEPQQPGTARTQPEPPWPTDR